MSEEPPTLTLFDAATPGAWIILHTKPQQERKVAADLAAKGSRYFLPLVSRVRWARGKKTQAPVPLFPGYVFLRGELDDAYELDRAKRLAGIIRVSDQVAIGEELKAIHEVLTRGAVLEMFPYLKTGVRVEVRAGPLEGVKGIIAGRTNRDRLILQVRALGAAASLEIDGDLLDVIEE